MPSFARSRAHRDRALKAYTRLHAAALAVTSLSVVAVDSAVRAADHGDSPQVRSNQSADINDVRRGIGHDSRLAVASPPWGPAAVTSVPAISTQLVIT